MTNPTGMWRISVNLKKSKLSELQSTTNSKSESDSQYFGLVIRFKGTWVKRVTGIGYET